MFEISDLKLNELTKIANVSPSLLSRKFKEIQDESLVSRKNNRITGISPGLTEEYLRENGFDYLYKGAFIMSANLCGGCSKTSGTINLGACMGRLTSAPIIYIDSDSQGSLSQQVAGAPASDNDPILIDFLEGKSPLKNIITPVNGTKNIYIIKSNLNNAYLDKVLSKPVDIKNLMLKTLKELFAEFGDNAKIFMDFPPQISNIFASTVAAISQLDKNIVKTLLVPLRADSFSINGGNHIIKEFYEVLDVFSLKANINVHCYFSSIDRRKKATDEAMKMAIKDKLLATHLSTVAIRYSSEVIKATMANTTIYKERKGTAPTDYQELLEYIFSQQHRSEVSQ